MYLFVLFRPLFWCWVNLFTAAIDLIKYLITCNWFWLIGSNNIYTRADWAQSPVKSNKIHVKENQSLTLTCESEGGLTFKWIEQICHFTQIKISWNRNWVWVRVKQFWHQCTLITAISSLRVCINIWLQHWNIWITFIKKNWKNVAFCPLCKDLKYQTPVKNKIRFWRLRGNNSS